MKRLTAEVLLLALVSGPCLAQTSQSVVLHDFGLFGDAHGPSSGVITDEAGNLYGVTPYGGANNEGAVYRLAPPLHGQTHVAETIIYSFAGGSDGGSPKGGLVMDQAGNLYGTTETGGSHLSGTIFRLSPPPPGGTVWVKTILHSFAGKGGADPQGALVLDGQGALYGTTYRGGSAGAGTVFELHPPKPGQLTWRKQVLYSFPTYVDGCPASALTFSKDAGTLYGTTVGCISTGYNSGGTVFALHPPAAGSSAWSEATLYDFSLSDSEVAWAPYSALVVDDSGALYGTTANSTDYNEYLSYGGTVFQLSPPPVGQTAWKLTFIHNFSNGYGTSEGVGPIGGLLRDARGTLYGTTYANWSGQASTLYKLQPPAAG